VDAYRASNSRVRGALWKALYVHVKCSFVVNFNHKCTFFFTLFYSDFSYSASFRGGLPQFLSKAWHARKGVVKRLKDENP
jgi:hypothetical protein